MSLWMRLCNHTYIHTYILLSAAAAAATAANRYMSFSMRAELQSRRAYSDPLPH